MTSCQSLLIKHSTQAWTSKIVETSGSQRRSTIRHWHVIQMPLWVPLDAKYQASINYVCIEHHVHGDEGIPHYSLVPRQFSPPVFDKYRGGRPGRSGLMWLCQVDREKTQGVWLTVIISVSCWNVPSIAGGVGQNHVHHPFAWRNAKSFYYFLLREKAGLRFQCILKSILHEKTMNELLVSLYTLLRACTKQLCRWQCSLTENVSECRLFYPAQVFSVR